MDNLKIPPHDIEAERGILGAMMLSKYAANLCRELLSGADFYHLAHQTLWRAICAVLDAGGKPDLVQLRHELNKQGELESVGDVAYLAQVLESVPTSANAEHYALIVSELSAKRALLEIAEHLRSAAQPGTEVQELIQRVERGLEGISASVEMVPTVGEGLPEVDAMLERWERGEQVGLATGLRHFDELTGGLTRGTLTIVAGLPREGKTALATNIALQAAEQTPVLFFSAEMSGAQLRLNMLTILSRISWRELRRGIPGERWPAWKSARAKLENFPLYIDQTPGIYVEELISRALRMVKRKSVALVIVDYIQLLGTKIETKRNLEVAHVGAQLKWLARKADVPVLALSQISSVDKVARLAWARELEQAADVIVFLGREQKYAWGKDEVEPDVARRRFKVEKNRTGPEGFFELEFNKPILTFMEAQKDAGEQGNSGAGSGRQNAAPEVAARSYYDTGAGERNSGAQKPAKQERGESINDDTDAAEGNTGAQKPARDCAAQSQLIPADLSEMPDVPEDEIPF